VSQAGQASSSGGGGGGGIETIDGDVGSVTGSTVELTGGSTGLIFTGVTATMTMSGTLTVPSGGTDKTSFTAYMPITGGTTTTGALQSVGTGTAGYVLTYVSSSALPTWQAASGSGIVTIDGDSGSVTGSTVELTGGTTGLIFTGSSATLTMSGTLAVKDGGTGDNSFTTYMPICGGTATQGALQSVGTSTAGYVLTYVSSSALPTFQNPNFLSTTPFSYAISDETSVITTSNNLTFRAPFACNISNIRASLDVASSSGAVKFDITASGTTIFSTLLQCDQSATTSVGSGTPYVLSTTSFTDDQVIVLSVNSAGTGATGAKITLYLTET